MYAEMETGGTVVCLKATVEILILLVSNGALASMDSDSESRSEEVALLRDDCS